MQLQSIFWAVVAETWLVAFRLRWLCRPKAMPRYAQHMRNYIRSKRILPSLGNPKGFNDFVKSSMVFNSDPRKALYADKLIAKEIAKLRWQGLRAPRTLAVFESAGEIETSQLPSQFVLKMNNDCGSTTFVGSETNISHIRRHFSLLFERPYGIDAGEWHYQHIRPKAFAEELLPLRDGASPGDYKFHCRYGHVGWCQYIFDRQNAPKEANFHIDGRRIPQLFDPHFLVAGDVNLPKEFSKMVDVATVLSEDFDYVRIDLYLIEGEIYFGEYTFTPCAGVYPRSIQHVFGSLLT